MERLSGNQARQVSEFLLDLYQLRTHEEFTSHVITALPKITEFHESTKTVLNAIRPHLHQALENALVLTQMQHQVAAMNQVMEEEQQALISVTKEGRIRFITPCAQSLLKQYGFQPRAGFDQLPTRLYDWLTHHQRQLNRSDDVPPALDPLLIQGEAGGLSIRLIVRGSQCLLILEERSAAHVGKDFASFGLSPRESEILGWVAQGKTNPEIGTILGISRRTVQKHLERINIKLGVENRTAASAMVAGIAQFTER